MPPAPETPMKLFIGARHHRVWRGTVKRSGRMGPRGVPSLGVAADIIPPVEYLVAIDIRLPNDLEADRREDLLKAEHMRGAALARAGILRAVWRVPGRLANRGIWEAARRDSAPRGARQPAVVAIHVGGGGSSRPTPAGRALPGPSPGVRRPRPDEYLRISVGSCDRSVGTQELSRRKTAARSQEQSRRNPRQG